MPFGLRNAAQTFQRFMDEVLCGLDFCYVYVDDLLIASSSSTYHVVHLWQVFDRLSQFGIVINAQKSILGVPTLTFLGHVVDSNGIRPTAGQSSSYLQFSQADYASTITGVPGIAQLLSKVSYNCAKLLLPLTNLLIGKASSKTPVAWSPSTELAFQSSKECLANATMLFHPRRDAPTSIATDASDFAVGAVLQQLIDGAWSPIAFLLKETSASRDQIQHLRSRALGNIPGYSARHALRGRSQILRAD